MNYWKGLMYAAAIDLIWIAGCPLLVTEPQVNVPVAERSYDVQPAVIEVEQINEVSRLEDSLMTYLNEHPDDVPAIEKVAHLYMRQGWFEAALRPLARAVELDPSRWGLWVALDEAVEKSGRRTISDAELTKKALEFKEAVEMWGMGC